MAAAVFIFGAGVGWWFSQSRLLQMPQILNQLNTGYLGSESTYSDSGLLYNPVYDKKFTKVQVPELFDEEFRANYNYLNSLAKTQSDRRLSPFYQDVKRAIPTQTTELDS